MLPVPKQPVVCELSEITVFRKHRYRVRVHKLSRHARAFAHTRRLANNQVLSIITKLFGMTNFENWSSSSFN